MGAIICSILEDLKLCQNCSGDCHPRPAPRQKARIRCAHLSVFLLFWDVSSIKTALRGGGM